MSDDADWAEFSDEEQAALAVLLKKTEGVLTAKDIRAALAESLFSIECSPPNPYSHWRREQDLGGGAATPNWKLFRAALQRRLAEKKEG